MGKEKKNILQKPWKKTKRVIWQGTSVYGAAKLMEISKDTLKQHLEAQGPNSRPGPSIVLSKRDEAQLVSFAKFVACSGSPSSPPWLREIATRLLNERYNLHVSECDNEL